MSDIRTVSGTDYIDEVKKMIAGYYTFLGRDLSFQDIGSELSNPAVKYSPPNGELPVALKYEKVIGMGRLSQTDGRTVRDEATFCKT